MPLNSWTPLISIIEMEAEMEGQRASNTRYKSALDWGRDEMPDDLDWRGALEAYDYADTGRRRAYEALGHVLHLVQDMGQPDHATNRPHPGNYLKDKGFPTEKLGYEALWREHNTWPLGATPKRVTSIEGAMNDMARAAQAAESRRGLPMADENASGLGPFHLEFPGASNVKEAFWRWAIRDNLWVKYELHVPLIPTINYPNNQDERTRKYLDLGNELMPLIEEQGAGLLIFFHDVVNPPPFVESVEIVQGGGTKYNKKWTDQTGGDRVTGRQASGSGGALEAGEQATVRIQFGPWQREPGPTGLYTDNSPKVREPVQEVVIWAVPSGASGQGCEREGVVRVDGGMTGDPDDSRGTSTWQGTFNPQKSGTLCIEAKDKNNHWKNRDRPGDVLDANPASAARVTSEAPYDWTGYEPGPDLNHSFTVGAPPGTECGQTGYTPEQLEEMRWGTWKGTWTRNTQGKEFDVAVGGHGKFWTTYSSEEKLSAEFRSSDKQYYPLNAEIEPPSYLTFGHTNGTYSEKGVIDVEYVDGFREHKDIDRASDAGVQGGINLRSDGGSDGPEYNLTPMEGDENDMDALVNLDGPVCPGEPISGTQTRESGNSSEVFWHHVVETWSFTFTPSKPPEHVTLLRTSFTAGYPEVTFWASSYQRRVDDMLQAVITELTARQRFNEVIQLQQVMDPALQYAYDEAQPVLDEHWTAVSAAYGAMDELWVSDEPGADAEYDQELAKLRSAIDRWKEAKGAIEERLASATEQAASLAQPVKPDVAENLRKLAADLRAKGLETVR
jgi:hypothetical protein